MKVLITGSEGYLARNLSRNLNKKKLFVLESGEEIGKQKIIIKSGVIKKI